METQLSWQGSIAVLTINNPSRRNALSDAVREDMIRHLGDLMGDRKCRGIVMNGSEGVYSSGGDVKNMKARGVRGMDFAERLMSQSPDSLSHRIVRTMVEGPKPVVQAIEGPALGAGLAYALLYRKSGKLWTAVISHAVTNGLLGIWVIWTGRWELR